MSNLAKNPDSREWLRAAALGESDALPAFHARFGETVRRTHSLGLGTHGDLGITERETAQGLARILGLVWDAEGDGFGSPPWQEWIGRLVLPDVFLAESVLRQSPAAWSRLEQVLSRAWRSLRVGVSGPGNRGLLDELRESTLGTFFLDDKIRTYRATAPLLAWTRQVLFNLFRQKTLQRKRDMVALSQVITDGEAGGQNLAPAATDPSPSEMAEREEWEGLLREAIPRALSVLDRDERRMLEVLPPRTMSQVDLAAELGVSPFRLSRWYKEVRERFVRLVTREIRLSVGLDEEDATGLLQHLPHLQYFAQEHPSAPLLEGEAS